MSDVTVLSEKDRGHPLPLTCSETYVLGLGLARLSLAFSSLSTGPLLWGSPSVPPHFPLSITFSIDDQDTTAHSTAGHFDKSIINGVPILIESRNSSSPQLRPAILCCSQSLCSQVSAAQHRVWLPQLLPQVVTVFRDQLVHKRRSAARSSFKHKQRFVRNAASICHLNDLQHRLFAHFLFSFNIFYTSHL